MFCFWTENMSGQAVFAGNGKKGVKQSLARRVNLSFAG